MSDHLSQDYIDALKSRDDRFVKIAAMIDLQTELRDSPFITAIRAAIRLDADTAMEDLAGTSPLDTARIASLLVKVNTFVYIRSVLDRIMVAGQAAEATVRGEDDYRESDERD